MIDGGLQCAFRQQWHWRTPLTTRRSLLVLPKVIGDAVPDLVEDAIDLMKWHFRVTLVPVRGDRILWDTALFTEIHRT